MSYAEANAASVDDDSDDDNDDWHRQGGGAGRGGAAPLDMEQVESPKSEVAIMLPVMLTMCIRDSADF